MKIKHQDLKIEAGKPFANCKLGREHYAEILTQVVATYADGMVLAVNNEWGTGKTTFVRMWQQYLKDKGFRTVYFNAWENDFDSNALVAILAELEPLTNDGAKDLFMSVLEKGAILAKNVLPGVIKVVTVGLIDAKELKEAVSEGIENAGKGITEILGDEIKAYANKKKTIEEFRATLEKFVKVPEDGKPLVFFVDELDRCRPSYAVEVLEQLKHLFSVPGIVFVLSVDKVQLAHAVRGYYGSDQINADEYLRRFIDLEYSMPRPSYEEFCKYLYEYYGYAEFFETSKRKGNRYANAEGEMFRRLAVVLFENSNSTLRQQDRVFALGRLVMLSFEEMQYTYSNLLFFFAFLKTLQNSVYERISSRSINMMELNDTFVNCVRGLKFDNVHARTQALLLYVYGRDLENTIGKGKIIERVGKADWRISYSPNPSGASTDDLNAALEMIYIEPYYSSVYLDYIIKKIDLLEPLQTQAS